MTEFEVKNNLIKSSIAWYPFVSGRRALLVTGFFSEFQILSDYLKSIGVSTESVTANNLNEYLGSDINRGLEEKIYDEQNYDYVILALAIESIRDIQRIISELSVCLNDNGKCLILSDNRLAAKYLSGDADMFTGNVLDGFDNYRGVNLEKAPGRAYSKDELENAISHAGFSSKFYGVFPSLFNANVFIADGYKPNENLMERFGPYYTNPATVFMDERYLYNTLRDNNLLISMANGFFIECSKDGDCTDYNQVTVQSNRDEDSALVTIIRDGSVIKQMMWESADDAKSKQSRLAIIKENSDYLEAHGVIMADSTYENGRLSTAYVKGPIATEYFQDLIENNLDLFFAEFDAFINVISDSSEHVSYDDVDWDRFDPNWDKRKDDDPNKDYWRRLAYGSDEDKHHIGPILKKGFIDLTTINCVRSKDGFVFFDQEFYVENLPVKALILRAIDFIWSSRPRIGSYLSMDDMLERYDLIKDRNLWYEFFNRPLRDILHTNEMNAVNKAHSVDHAIMRANRHRMNYSQEDYEHYFADIFRDVYSYRCYIFGSGVFAQRFIQIYGANLDIIGAVDNNESKWGETIGDTGVEIMSPDVLNNESGRFKVFLCIKYYGDVLKQLKEMGVKNISIYTPNVNYPLPRKKLSSYRNGLDGDENPSGEMILPTGYNKPYHIGYVAGVFDVFHIGHVNLLRRAKEQCDYLIVGVVSDEQVIMGKKTAPYYSFAERIEIVSACRYVDEAVKIPYDRSGTEDAYRMYRFDAQFSGSDYENDPNWLAARAYLRQHGSDLIFFPYTESTSSTSIKEQLRSDSRTH